MTGFDLQVFWAGLTPAQRDQFAADAKTSAAYIRLHLVTGRKMPRRKSIRRLLVACQKHGAPDLQEPQLLWWFYERQPIQSARKKLPAKRPAPAAPCAAAAA